MLRQMNSATAMMTRMTRIVMSTVPSFGQSMTLDLYPAPREPNRAGVAHPRLSGG
jgi:hypothetical protein